MSVLSCVSFLLDFQKNTTNRLSYNFIHSSEKYARQSPATRVPRARIPAESRQNVGKYVLPWLGFQTLASQSTVSGFGDRHIDCSWNTFLVLFAPEGTNLLTSVQQSRSTNVVSIYMLPLQHQTGMSQCCRTENPRAAHIGVDASHFAVGLDELVQHKQKQDAAGNRPD
jgi:hypothetical protein